MPGQKEFERCLAYVISQTMGGSHRPSPCQSLPTVTISRQVGTNAEAITARLASILESESTGPEGKPCPWPVFDRNLIDIVLRDHNLPESLRAFLPEDKVSLFRTLMRELLGVHPPAWTLQEHLVETVRKLARMGGVILVGRGANFMTYDLPNVFHVRLVGSLEVRIRRIVEQTGCSAAEAAKYIEREDRARRRFVRDLFQKDIDDPTAYHMILCTDRFEVDEAARLIADCVLQRRGIAKPEPSAAPSMSGSIHPAQ